MNMKLDENIYMKMPSSYRYIETILKLNKTLYSLRRSPLLWQRELTFTLKKIEFQPVSHKSYYFTCGGILVSNTQSVHSFT